MEIEVIDGVEWRREHHANGQLFYEQPHVNGQFHGLCRSWHKNGQMWYEHPFVNGKAHGLRREWHENGQLWCEKPYVNGEPHGLCRWWYENGQLWFVQLWNKSRLVFEIDNPPQTSGKWKLK